MYAHNYFTTHTQTQRCARCLSIRHTNRYESLMRAIASVQRQTYTDIEIVVVNDASRDERYYTLHEDATFIHLPYNIGRPGHLRDTRACGKTCTCNYTYLCLPPRLCSFTAFKATQPRAHLELVWRLMITFVRGLASSSKRILMRIRVLDTCVCVCIL
jgi:hypothetical protein